MAKPKAWRPVFTYQTRLRLSPDQDRALQAWADLMGRAERRLFALRQGEARGRAVPTEAAQEGARIPISIKRRLMTEFGLTGRQFNAVETQLDGRIDAITERRPGLIEDGERRLERARHVVGRLAHTQPGTNKLHHKRRRLAALEASHAALLADEAVGRVRLCFGSRTLFRAQFALQENGYADLDAWRAEWRAARADQIYILGSGDEVCGNQTCQARGQGDGTLALTLKLPDRVAAAFGGEGLDRHGRLTVGGLRFAYGQEEIEWALAQSRRVRKVSKTTGQTYWGYEGVAISYRLQRDARGWRVLASLELEAPSRVTAREAGALGVDINADHLAVAELDRAGSPVRTLRLDLPLRGKSPHQKAALIGKAAKGIAAWARRVQKPLVLEVLDFARRKAELEAVDPAQARALSSLAYRQILTMLTAAAFRAGVEAIRVNPAYTSTIGAVNHAARLGISTHQGAAIAIARRGLGLSERPAWAAGERARARVPRRDGTHVTLPLPARKAGRHVWAQWAAIRRDLKAALAAPARSDGPPGPDAPGVFPRRGPRVVPVGSRSANPPGPSGSGRPHSCSADVQDGIPWL